jgi:hypothetical protein
MYAASSPGNIYIVKIETAVAPPVGIDGKGYRTHQP